ncbi:hypothetical protein [Candidatus Electronema sp. PJ]|uniref:hypothetical protein n=1 Tax=Candidatus Electronema sp. PJ TaxID=3401572 RepID=UPI003AA8C370
MRTIFLLLIALFLLALVGCREDSPALSPAEGVKEASQAPLLPGCRSCHADIQLDVSHDFACTECHQGNNETNDKELAHQGLTAQPAAPENIAAACGRCSRCHTEQVEGCGQVATHFTLENEVNLVRNHFGLEPLPGGMNAIPDRSGPPQNKEQLVDDLLRRRCLRCHVQSPGDNYPSVQHGSGCAACHLRKTEGKLASHIFKLPVEQQCLSCHYGNRVGSDFVGMYEHDYGADFRSPQATTALHLRPYGIEQHNLVQDIHRQRGLTCIDCHSGKELFGKQQKITCVACHAPAVGSVPPLKNIRADKEQLFLTTRQDSKEHLIPRLQHPAHARYGDRVDCQVCHAQWSFNDQTTHLLLSYATNTEPWQALKVQSSSEVENFLTGEADKPSMTDSLTGQKKPGIWYQGYSLRRWENILIRQDKDGILKVFRPLLDLRLSAIDANGEIIAGLDNITGQGDGLLPYIPHTTGPAGLFYEQRFLPLLDAQQSVNP